MIQYIILDVIYLNYLDVDYRFSITLGVHS
jgi:hypothetical protein